MSVKVFSAGDEINFGTRHKGELIDDVMVEDPSYLVWCLDNISWFQLDEYLTQELEIATGENLDSL